MLGAVSAGLWMGLGAEMLGAAKGECEEPSFSTAGRWHGATDRSEAGFPRAGAAPCATEPFRQLPSGLSFLLLFFFSYFLCF